MLITIALCAQGTLSLNCHYTCTECTADRCNKCQDGYYLHVDQQLCKSCKVDYCDKCIDGPDIHAGDCQKCVPRSHSILINGENGCTKPSSLGLYIIIAGVLLVCMIGIIYVIIRHCKMKKLASSNNASEQYNNFEERGASTNYPERKSTGDIYNPFN